MTQLWSRKRFSTVSTTSLERTARHWGVEGSWALDRGSYWSELPAVQRRLNAKVSGDPDVDWVAYTLRTHLSALLPVERCLSLGCGRGGLERYLADLHVFTSCDAYDVAPTCIAEARQLAEERGYRHIHYAVADINQMELPGKVYDVVWVHAAMHHFERLERVCTQIQHSLKPEGLLVLNDYVGPSRFQFPSRQREACQAAFMCLPPRYRRLADQRAEEMGARTLGRRGLRWVMERFWDKLQDGDLLATMARHWAAWRASRSGEAFIKEFSLPTARDVAAGDPSEAIRSADILEVVSRFFTVIDHKDLGGTLLQFVLDGIACNFDDDDPQVGRLLELLFQVEDTLLAVGDLQSDFVYLVARPKC